MSTVLHPVGPQRARVYWVRRLLVVGVLVLVASLVWAVSSRLLGGDGDAAAATSQETPADEAPEAAAEDEPATEEEPAEDAEEQPATPVDCASDSLQVTLTASAQTYDAATNPVLTVSVTNIGDVPCTVDAGDANREVLITSGPDRIWSSKDCATDETASRQLLLDAGAADSVPIEWARNRTAEGCPADLPAPRAGTYQAVSTLGEESSVPVVFALE